MHQVHTGRSPRYLSSLVTATANIPSRAGLRSGNSQRYELPRTVRKFGERSFSFAGPSAWNMLPRDLQQQNYAKTCIRLLKTFLFSLAYSSNWLCNVPLVAHGVSGAIEIRFVIVIVIVIVIHYAKFRIRTYRGYKFMSTIGMKDSCLVGMRH